MVSGSLEYICDKDSFNKYAKRENAEIVFDDIPPVRFFSSSRVFGFHRGIIAIRSSRVQSTPDVIGQTCSHVGTTLTLFP